jgi:hypothetical protein
LNDKIQDLRLKGNFVKPANVKKTPFSKTFGASDDVALGSGKTTIPKKTSDVQKIVDKLDDIRSTPTPRQSEYYGTGMYERTDVMGLSPKETVGLQNQLKASVTPPDLRVMQVKDAIKVKIDTGVMTGVKSASALALGVGVKSDLKLKTDLKLNTQIKAMVKEDVAVKQAGEVAVKTSPALKTQLKSLLQLDTTAPPVATPSTSFTPNLTMPSPPIPKPFIFWLPSKKTSGKGKGRGKGFNEYAYLPDFTSRALGLGPVTISEKQAQAKLKQILTGLEIRRGVRIR